MGWRFPGVCRPSWHPQGARAAGHAHKVVVDELEEEVLGDQAVLVRGLGPIVLEVVQLLRDHLVQLQRWTEVQL